MPALGAALGPREDPEQLEGSLTIKSGKKKKKKKKRLHYYLPLVTNPLSNMLLMSRTH